jgi:asparagine synthase (glutamine-hydrolysing)
MNDPASLHWCGKALPGSADAGHDLSQAAAWLHQNAGDPARMAELQGGFAIGASGQPGCAAVDRFARETLCVRVDTQGALQVAERADALADAATPLNLQALFDYAFFHVIPAPRTIFEGVLRVPAGHLAQATDGQPQLRRFWAPQFSSPRQTPSFDALKAEFRSLLRDAVAREYDGGVPGCFLSGGTDSSTVAGMLTEVAGRPAETFSIGFEAEGYDEMAFARIAARHFGCRHHEYYVTPEDLLRSIPSVAASFDQPFGNSSAVPAYHCALQAKAQGVTRMLAGDGGDELFGGNSRYAKQRLFDAYGDLPAWLRKGVLEPVFLNGTAARLPLARKVNSYIEQAMRPMPGRTHLYNLVLRLGVERVFEPRFLRRIDQGAPLAWQQQVWDSTQADTRLNQELAYDWRFTLAESDLPKVRGATRLAGVGVGYPMLDDALLAFSARLPSDWKLRGDKLRWFFKEALRGFLPDEILTKKKQGFGLPFGVWATRHTALAQLAGDSLRSLGTRGLVRPAFIDELLRVHLPAHPGYYGEMVWILMMLEQWLQAHKPEFRLDD